MKIIPYGRQNITQDDVQAVVRALQSDYLTQGPRIKEFEDAFASYVGASFAVAVSNGTAALHLSALALGVTEQSKVITTPITFAASANCIRYCGGEVVFADIDPETYLLDISAVRRLLERAPKGTFDGIIPVDFAGKAVDLEAYKQLAEEFGLWIIEDACHAPGGYFLDSNGSHQYCGNGKFADLAIFSFHPVKHIAAGEGGMITTNDERLYQRLLRLRTHGITRDSSLFVNNVNFANGGLENTSIYPGWYMEMQELGFNYRLTDFQAALGLSQLGRADVGLARRREIALLYDRAFLNNEGISSQFNEIRNIPGHAYHLYVILAKNRLRLYEFLRDNNIHCQIHYIPVHLMPYYRSLGWTEGQLVHAEEYYKKCLSLPMFPSLTNEEVAFVIDKILKFYTQ